MPRPVQSPPGLFRDPPSPDLSRPALTGPLETRPHRTSRDLLTRCSHITYHWYVSVNCHMRTPRSLSAIHPRKILIIGRRKHPAKRDFNFWALARTAGKYRRTRGRERRSSGGRRPPCRGMATRTPRPKVPKSCNPDRPEDKVRTVPLTRAHAPNVERSEGHAATSRHTPARDPHVQAPAG